MSADDVDLTGGGALVDRYDAIPSCYEECGRGLFPRASPRGTIDALVRFWIRLCLLLRSDRRYRTGPAAVIGQTSGERRTTISDFGPTLAEQDPGSPAHRLEGFRAAVLEHYRAQGRDLPWRRTRDPYSILVSEIMLQQTQVARVLPKYRLFLDRYPELPLLARAPLGAVLEVWQGLGYNRRALSLHRTAQIVVDEHEGRLPRSFSQLRRLPGIGPATAAAVCVFAYGDPLVFIETNIRSVFLHHFFPGCVDVPDRDILPLVEATLDREDPRRWYYALMDYGVWLKKTNPNPSRGSRHHAIQTPFEGSRRQLRARTLRAVLEAGCEGRPAAAPGGAAAAQAVRGLDSDVGVDASQVGMQVPDWDSREVQSVLDELVGEGFLAVHEGRYRIA